MALSLKDGAAADARYGHGNAPRAVMLTKTGGSQQQPGGSLSRSVGSGRDGGVSAAEKRFKRQRELSEQRWGFR